MARPVDPRLWRHARSARRYLALSVTLSLTTTLCIVVAALALARVLAGVITEPAHRDIGSWTTELLVFTAAVAIRITATWWQARLAHRAGAQVVAELETAVVAAGAALPPRELDSRRTELAVIAGNGLSGLRAYLAGYLPALLLACLVPPVVLAVIAAHDLVSGVIVVITLPLIPIFMILIGLLTKGRAEQTLTATTRLSDQLLDLFAGMPTLRALGRETGGVSRASASETTAAQPDSSRTTMRHRVADLGDTLRRRTMSALRIAFLSSMVLEMLATLSVALVAVSIGMRLVFGDMPLYAGLVALILAPEVYLPLRMVGERFHAAQDGMAAAEKAFAVLDPAPRPAPGRHSAGATVAAHPVGHIEIRDLSVVARDGFAPCGLSAVLRPGAVTALTGPNGCGKSTVLQAILGLLTPDRGAVTVSGTPVPDLDADHWWSHIAWLPQRPVLLPGTLRANLELLGAPANADDLTKATAATGFDEVLETLPDGWDTLVGTGGTGLSLGQRQRLALTRTLAAPRPILLLDEPTAHLDEDSEATVLAALTARARAGATVVVVAHRPSVLAAADHIIEVRAEVTANESGPSGKRPAEAGAPHPARGSVEEKATPGGTGSATATVCTSQGAVAQCGTGETAAGHGMVDTTAGVIVR
ncbi:thiol reductant ABC exporter subunit CydD [Nocardia huaxiensis]|uniref:Thiol reductant ABC exporter subunit CydD n=1 Tax=Nocardia huaxiensis TaxID=2755382 RepID=A0A7D6ZNL1_9NOCA|nr:thiol reductant ABC exporter subunit CydD [Nocardia huaxiensis]QLY31603.1 thiol reductant ABC exporter subunit CydD [Nocardia huaxiensis]